MTRPLVSALGVLLLASFSASAEMQPALSMPEVLLLDLDGRGISEPQRSTDYWPKTDQATGHALILLHDSGRRISASDVLGIRVGPPNGFSHLIALIRGEAGRPQAQNNSNYLDDRHNLFSSLVLWQDFNDSRTVEEPEVQSLQYAGFSHLEWQERLAKRTDVIRTGQITQRGRARRSVKGRESWHAVVAVSVATRLLQFPPAER